MKGIFIKDAERKNRHYVYTTQASTSTHIHTHTHSYTRTRVNTHTDTGTHTHSLNRDGTNTEIFGFDFSFQICHEYSNTRYWTTSGIGLSYINIAVAESADRLARSFDVTLCKH